MKSSHWDEALLLEHRKYIQSENARGAFDALVAAARLLPGFDCAPDWHGEIRDFRYLDRGSGEQPFAFIVNRSDLLFYVRKPGLLRVPEGLAGLKRRFGTVRENPSGEWTVRVTNVEEAQGLSRFLFGSEFQTDPAQRYWWVNHKQTFRHEVEGEYLWSPKKNQNGANNESYNNMTKVFPGDIVFSFADAAIRAVGVALGRARETPKPAEFGVAGNQWGTAPGWQVAVRFKELTRPLRPKDYSSQLAPLLPHKHSPIRASGDGNQGVYLTAVPERMARTIIELLAGQVEEITESITDTTGVRLADDAAEERIQQRTDIGPLEKLNLVKSRRGQGIFREYLEQIEKKCRVTGILDRRHLRASHIKPWCICDDREKLDGYNGLLLSPHVDHLFDRGYISFSDNGDLLLSKHLNRAVLESWGISSPRNVGSFSEEQRRYLEYHRANVFEKSSSRRRAQSSGSAEEPEITVHGEPVVVHPE
jgi:putative restriction endonuclease